MSERGQIARWRCQTWSIPLTKDALLLRQMGATMARVVPKYWNVAGSPQKNRTKSSRPNEHKQKNYRSGLQLKFHLFLNTLVCRHPHRFGFRNVSVFLKLSISALSIALQTVWGRLATYAWSTTVKRVFLRSGPAVQGWLPSCSQGGSNQPIRSPGTTILSATQPFIVGDLRYLPNHW